MNDLHNVASTLVSALISTAVGVGLGIAAYFGQPSEGEPSPTEEHSEALEASRRVRDLAEDCAGRVADIDAKVRSAPRVVTYVETTPPAKTKAKGD